MIQVQLRIELIEKTNEDSEIKANFDVLRREDVKQTEIDIAHSIEEIFISVLKSIPEMVKNLKIIQ